MASEDFQSDPRLPEQIQNVGLSSETQCQAIELPLTKASLILVLRCALDIENSPYTHQQIAWWADGFQLAQFDQENHVEAAVADIALDLHLQWQIYLENTYAREELQTLDFSKIQLPAEWFSKWLAQLDA